MRDVKQHYDTHLGDIYAWMAGDFKLKQQEQQALFLKYGLHVLDNGTAIDLGAGHGLQSVSLAQLGFRVLAVDFNRQILDELSTNSVGLSVEIIKDDLRNVRQYQDARPELIICAGDTIAHLASWEEIECLIQDIYMSLSENGKLVLSFRDYANALTGDDRFIPVKSDDSRILTCCLEYLDNRVLVTDLLHIRSEAVWKQQISSYYKVRVTEPKILGLLQNTGFRLLISENVNRMINVVAQK